jgi:hypothetical protein
MNGYFGKHWSTGKWAAWITKAQPCGPVEQWGQTEQEAKDKLNRYLQAHWNMRVEIWEKTSANEHC